MMSCGGMMPYLHRHKVSGYFNSFIRGTDQICGTWNLDQPVDMLVEMRRVALLILMETLFNVDMTPDIDRLWKPILRTLKYISPGTWLIWRNIPRPGFRGKIGELDEYIYGLIASKGKIINRATTCSNT